MVNKDLIEREIEVLNNHKKFMKLYEGIVSLIADFEEKEKSNEAYLIVSRVINFIHYDHFRAVNNYVKENILKDKSDET